MSARGKKRGKPAGARPGHAGGAGSAHGRREGDGDAPGALPGPAIIAPDSPVARLLARAGRRRGPILVALAAIGGAMVFLACADFDIWPLAWLAMLPALVAIEAASTLRRAALLGWLTGLVLHVGGFYWLTGMLIRFGHLPRPVALLGLLLLCGYQALVLLLFARAVRQIRRRSAARLGAPLPMVLVAPLAMVTFEFLVPFLFPCPIAITQAWQTPVIQIAELTGPLGVTALLVMVSGAAYDALTATTRRRRLLPLAGAAAVMAAVLVFGNVRIGQIAERRAAAPAIEVGVVQGNIPFDEKGLKRPDLAAGQLRGLQKVSAELEEDGADLILWSESSYPYAIARSRTRDYPEGNPRRLHDGFSAPLVLGAITRPDDPAISPYNSALFVDRDGTFRGRFDKIFLLLFGEYVPFHDLLEGILPRNAGHFSRGEKISTFPFIHEGVTYRLGPMICYEDILPEFGRELAALHPHLLINLTNDAWYGDTSEPWQHLALSVFRAVEARADLVRSVNTGVSAFIDATGRVAAKSYAVDPHETPTPMTGHISRVALMESGHTFYARFGDVFSWALTGATPLLWIGWPLALRLRRKRIETT
jgi:apolipoprotein N-acyltransferase